MIDKVLAAFGIKPETIRTLVEDVPRQIHQFGDMFKMTAQHYDRRLSEIEAKLDRLQQTIDGDNPPMIATTNSIEDKPRV